MKRENSENKIEKPFDMDWLNALPVSVKAREMLIQAGETPDPRSMYIVQLARWGLAEGCRDAHGSIVETVTGMASWKTVRAMNFFMFDLVGGYDPPGWESAENPDELAGILIDDIEEKMFLHFPWYVEM